MLALDRGTGRQFEAQRGAQLKWWQRGVVYQVYPRSFRDASGDGVGDLTGVIEKLDYLQALGVDALWLSPVFPSPMADFGYDVSDYCAIDPVFGTLAQFDALVAGAHARGLKVILDFVPNHTSDRHPWFEESRRARASPRRDWYLWRDPAPGGGPPNNWLSQFGGSAWEFDAATGQYYYHAFLKEQPDLNWRNPAVRAAMYDVLRFWLRRGVDGFRVDVIYHLLKDPQFRDNPPNPAYRESEESSHRQVPLYTVDQPDVHALIEEMRGVVDEFDDRLLIGEIYLPLERLVAYYGRDLRGAHLPFNFQLIQTTWHAGRIAELVRAYEAALPPGGWPNWVLGNHDKPRIASRVGQAQARVAAMLLLTLRGTPTLYYGDELGMEDVAIPPDEVQDPFERNEPGKGLGRDPQRTPMQWDASVQAGFSRARPWLRLGPDWQQRNVAAQWTDERSLLSLYRALLALRRTQPALTQGGYEPLPGGGDVLAFERACPQQRLAVALNFGGAGARLRLARPGRVLLSTALDRADEPAANELLLRPNEGVIVG
jgi:alpha-glucosidase